MSPSPCRLTFLVLVFILLLGCRPGTAGPTGEDTAQVSPIAGLDQKAVHDEYMNGNFENVIAQISAFQKENPNHSRSDSLFIARHLAVVHAADPLTLEAGKYWMHRLLLLSPAADLVGMYASEEIERTFDRVRQEAKSQPGGQGRRRWLWIGASGTALATVVTWLVLSSASDGGEPTVVAVEL